MLLFCSLNITGLFEVGVAEGLAFILVCTNAE